MKFRLPTSCQAIIENNFAFSHVENNISFFQEK